MRKVAKDPAATPPPPRHDKAAREGFGGRLRAARKLSGKSLEDVAAALLDEGYKYSKQAIGHWETGERVPDAIILKRLAKLYGTTADALLWDESVSIEAIRFAVEYDSLNEAQKRNFQMMWMAYFAASKSDKEVEDAFEEAAKKGHSDFTYTRGGKVYHVEVRRENGLPEPRMGVKQ